MSAATVAHTIPIIHNLNLLKPDQRAALDAVRAIVDASGLCYGDEGLTGYARISSDGDGRGLGVERQVRDFVTLARHIGEPVRQVVIENDKSASEYATKPRELWPIVVDGLRNGPSRHVLATSTSRLTRDVGELHELLKLRRIGASFSTSQGVRMHPKMTAWEVQMVRDAGTRDAAESDLISERVTPVFKDNAERGVPHGVIAFGWDRERMRNGMIVETLIEDQAAVIREAAERILAGQSTRSIAADFAARDLPSPTSAGWTQCGLRKAMTRERNAGRRSYRGKVVAPGAWPAILDGDVHDAVVAILNDPARKPTRGKPRHLLSGLIVCGRCASERVYVRRGISYGCLDCHGLTRLQAPIDLYVAEAVVERLAEPDALDFLAIDAGALEAARARLATLRGKLAERVDMFDAGELDRESYGRSATRIRAEIAVAEAEVQSARPVPAAVRELAGHETVEAARAAWELLPLDGKREVVRSLVTITLLPTTRRKFDEDTLRLDWRTTLPTAR